MIDISAQYPMADISVCSKLGMRSTESAAGAQNWGEKLFGEIYLDKDRVSVSCEKEFLEMSWLDVFIN